MPDSPARLIEEGLLREIQRLRDHPAALVMDELRWVWPGLPVQWAG